MTSIARSSASKQNENTLRVHKVKVFFHLFPGKQGDDQTRAIGPDIEYSLYVNDRFSQSGELAADGSATLYIPSGQRAELQVLGTSYRVEPNLSLAEFDSLRGVQERLALLGYLAREANDEWDSQFERAILNFQMDHGIDPNGLKYDLFTTPAGALLDDTVDRIRQEVGE